MLNLATAQVTTGSVATVVDKYDSTVLSNNAKNPLGMKYYDPVNPTNVYRYVRYNSTANAAVQTNPAVVWWTDNTFTTVTSTVSEALSRSHIAGWFMGGTSVTGSPFNGLSATPAKTLLNGNYIFIQTGGYLAGALVAASTAVGDFMLATQADWTTTGGLSRVAKGAAVLERIPAYGQTAVSNGLSDIFIVVES